jgi:hypothetical protein
LNGNGWWKRAWSGTGNGGVATVTPGGSHRPSRCRDEDCARLLCRGYKLGYADGFDDGQAAGYEAGFAAGEAAGYDAGFAAGAATCE